MHQRKQADESCCRRIFYLFSSVSATMTGDAVRYAQSGVAFRRSRTKRAARLFKCTVLHVDELLPCLTPW